MAKRKHQFIIAGLAIGILLILAAVDLYNMAVPTEGQVVREVSRPSNTNGEVPVATTARWQIVRYTVDGQSREMTIPAPGSARYVTMHYYQRWPRIAWFGGREDGALALLGLPIAFGIVALITTVVRRLGRRWRNQAT